MKVVRLEVEDYIFEFYKKIGEMAGGLTTEQVMSDALFKFAGDISVKVSDKV